MLARLGSGHWISSISTLLTRGGGRVTGPRVLVIGVGGAGGNAVNNMIRGDLRGVEFCVLNTDVQALDQSLARHRLQLGRRVTRGLGAGARVPIGQVAAEESMDDIKAMLRGADMVFITAGMGGGTGTGAAPVVAAASRRAGILTVGVITKPFHFEGEHRMRLAEGGVGEMREVTDTLLVIPNQNLIKVADARTTFVEAFRMADEVVHDGVRGISDLMVVPGLVNLDFADVRTVMADGGLAMMGTGEAEGAGRAVAAAEQAMSNPLIEDGTISGARGVLINVTGGPGMTLFDVNEAVGRIRQEADPTANIIFGSAFNKKLGCRMRISVVATGLSGNGAARRSDAARVWIGPDRAVPDVAAIAAPHRVAPAEAAPDDGLLTTTGWRALLRTGKPRAGAAVLAILGVIGGVAMQGELSTGGGAPPNGLAGEVGVVGARELLAGEATAALAEEAAPGLAAAPDPAPIDGPLATIPEATGSVGDAARAAPASPRAKRTRAARPAPVAPATIPAGYKLQIGAFRSIGAAQQGWTRLRRAHADLLDGVEASGQGAEFLDHGSLWRLRVGPIPDRSTAEGVCEELKRRGAECLLLEVP
jgi:cell division protein FtsZ